MIGSTGKVASLSASTVQRLTSKASETVALAPASLDLLSRMDAVANQLLGQELNA